MSHVRIGIAGPVGSGKTALIEALVRKMADEYSIGVVTNDIYTHEDAQFLPRTRCCPPTALWAWRPAAARTLPFARTRA